MDKEVGAAIIGAAAALAGAVVGAVAAWKAASSTNRIQERIAADNLAFQKQLAQDSRKTTIEGMILKLSEFAIEYPTLEKDAYCAAYPNCPGDPNGKERYENYCVYVFNALGQVFDFCEGDIEKINRFASAEELIRRHYRCWQADVDNLSHDGPFVLYVQSVIDDLRKRKVIQ